MSNAEHILDNREMGQFPLSIATSLAMEGSVGIHPDFELPEPLLPNYQRLMVNVETLIRNIIGSVGRLDALHLTSRDVLQVLVEEMQHIVQICKDLTSPVEVLFYRSMYPQLFERLPMSVYRTKLTAQQQLVETIATDIFKQLPNFIGEMNFEVITNQSRHDASTLMLTHIVLDLLSNTRYPQLDLLESHTGVIKKKHQWWSKLNKCELKSMPFNLFTIQVYGDVLHFHSSKPKLKAAVEALAEQFSWTPNTTLDRILLNIGMMQDREFQEHIQIMATSARSYMR